MTDVPSADAAPLSIERVRHPAAVVSRVQGELDISTAPLLRSELNELAQGTDPVVLGVEGGNFPLLLLTLAVSVVTFGSGRTNILQGCIHLLLFAVFLLLIFFP